MFEDEQPSWLEETGDDRVLMHRWYSSEVLQAAFEQLDLVYDGKDTFILNGLLDYEGEKQLEIESRRSLVDHERILNVVMRW